jgi:hypothetical protein
MNCFVRFPRQLKIALAYFHGNELEGLNISSLKAGQEVEFELGQDKKGRSQAIKVRFIEIQAPEPPPYH